LLVDATVDVSHGRSILAALLAPLLAPLVTLLNLLDDDVERCFPATAWGWVKSGSLVVDVLLGGSAAQLGGILDGVGRHLERS
jgi:hypothetical protein